MVEQNETGEASEAELFPIYAECGMVPDDFEERTARRYEEYLSGASRSRRSPDRSLQRIDRGTMHRYPILICTCEGDGIYVLGAGKNPMAEVRRLDTGETVGYGPMQLMSIVAHIDIGEWEEVPEAAGASAEPRPDLWPLSDEDRREIQQRIQGLLRESRTAIRDEWSSPQQVLNFVLNRARWESMEFSEALDQGFRNLVREAQLTLIEPVLAEQYAECVESEKNKG